MSLNSLEFGVNGTYLAEGTTAKGDFSIIKTVNGDATVSVKTNWENAPENLELTIVQGDPQYGIFTEVTATTGNVVCYE